MNEVVKWPTRFQEVVALGGVAWLQREPLVAIQELEGDGIADAISIIDADNGRMLAFIGPDFPPGDKLANIDAADLAELIKLFDHVDAWFAPRLRAVVCSTAYAIRHGWSTHRDAHALLKKSPVEIVQHRHGRRFVQMLVTAGISLARAREFFPALRGRPADETREFFLEQLAKIAIDNGMELRLPQDRDPREGGVTAFYTFVLAVIDIVLSRVLDTAGSDPAVRRRAAAFRWSRIALLHALERVKEKLAKSTA
jgi:hypothetical protein